IFMTVSPEYFSVNIHSLINIDTFKKLEIYGVQISGFKMTILCLDKLGFGLYRIRTIDEVTIPVNVVENNSIDRTFEGLMTKEYVDNVKSTVKSKKRQAINLEWERSIPKTI
ncbi:4161_t:CDS:2, partial [Funneliformis geosporum]